MVLNLSFVSKRVDNTPVFWLLLRSTSQHQGFLIIFFVLPTSFSSKLGMGKKFRGAVTWAADPVWLNECSMPCNTELDNKNGGRVFLGSYCCSETATGHWYMIESCERLPLHHFFILLCLLNYVYLNPCLFLVFLFIFIFFSVLLGVGQNEQVSICAVLSCCLQSTHKTWLFY